jgi:hypothetical protein
MYLFIIDFDSMIDAHSNDKQEQKECWKKVLEYLISNEQPIAIVSHHKATRQQMEQYLNEVVGVEKDTVPQHIKMLSFTESDDLSSWIQEQAALQQKIVYIGNENNILPQSINGHVAIKVSDYSSTPELASDIISMARIADIENVLHDSSQSLQSRLHRVKSFLADNANQDISAVAKDRLIQLSLLAIADTISDAERVLRNKINAFGEETVADVYSVETVHVGLRQLCSRYRLMEANLRLYLHDERPYSEASKLIDAFIQRPLMEQEEAKLAKQSELLVSHVYGKEPAVAGSNKLLLREQFSATPQTADMNRFLKISGKIGGAQSAGKYGGIYVHPYFDEKTNRKKMQRILFKQEVFDNGVNHSKNIAEVVAGRIMNTTIGELAASVFFATRPTQSHEAITLPDETGENVYVGSIYYDQSRDLFKVLGFTDRPRMIGSWNKETFLNGVPTKDKSGEVRQIGFLTPERPAQPRECNFENFNQIVVGGVLVGDFDVHSGNFMVVPGENPDKEGMLVKIDHGGSLEGLEDHVHMHSYVRHIPGAGPTNHIREFPRDLKVNIAFAAELDRQASIDLRGAIEEAMNEVATYYGKKPLADFARYIGMAATPHLTDLPADQLLGEIKRFLITKVMARQRSLQQLAVEIRLSLCIKEDKEGKFIFSHEAVDIDQLIKKNPLYFLKENYHFRSREQRSLFGPVKTRLFKRCALIRLVRNRVGNNVIALINDAVNQSNPKVIEHLLVNRYHLLRKIHDESIVDNYRAILSNTVSQLLARPVEDVTREAIDEILQERSLPHRALIVARWLTVMRIMMGKEQQLACAVAIKDAMQNPAIARLRHTFAAVPAELKKQLILSPELKRVQPDAIKAKRKVEDQDLLLSRTIEPDKKAWGQRLLNSIKAIIQFIMYPTLKFDRARAFKLFQEAALPSRLGSNNHHRVDRRNPSSPRSAKG